MTHERRLEIARNWYKRNKAKVRASYLFTTYGLTQDEHSKLLKKQRNLCAICRGKFKGSPHVDHDHATGEVRGLLCNACNVGLGRFRDDANLIDRAAKYLRNPPCSRPKK